MADFGVGEAIAISAVMSAASAAMAGIQQSQMQRYNASLQDQNAAIQQQQAEAEAERRNEQAQKTIASSRAAFAKSGLDSSVGSPVDLLSAQAGDAEYDYLLTKYRGALGARDFYASASSSRVAANDALVGGFMQAGSALLTGASKLYSRIPSSAADSASGIGGGYGGIGTPDLSLKGPGGMLGGGV